MAKPIIEVENLSKLYNLGLIGSTTFREMIERKWYKLLGNEHQIYKIGHKHLTIDPSDPQAGPEPNTLWALKDVSFSVNQGEVVGIIGKNGSGKSTLLKILCKITEPTRGRAIVRGRVASLLEVGTGFHPELTGRENIYLNGAILGMRKREIDQKFDKIVEFAEIEIFIDTPVKRYSSGMYVRLAFAVAAHLEPEILFIDEVLAVGDVAFQKKCLNRMSEISTKDKRTILFVSHNMTAIQQLCSQAILLVNGKVEDSSRDVRSVINQYLLKESSRVLIKAEWVNNNNEYSNPYFKPLRFYVGDGRGNVVHAAASNCSDIWVYIECEIYQTDPVLKIGYDLLSDGGILVYRSFQTDTAENNWPRINKGKCILRSKIPPIFLNEGLYHCALSVSLHNRLWILRPEVHKVHIDLAIKPIVTESPLFIERRETLLAPIINWELY